MKTNILIGVLMIVSTFGFSQEINTRSSNDGLKTNTLSGYGGPLLQAASINNDWGIMIGGKGGVIINGKLALGGIGKGLATTMEFLGDDLDSDNDASLDLNYGAGGLFIEYLIGLERTIHLSIPVNFMAGKMTVSDATSSAEVESSGVFILEPGINLEFTVSNNFIPALNLSYRQVFGSSLENLSNQDLAGVNIGLILKFGSF